ncbi:MAG: hypothetical protein HYV09_02785 [Deltaproteobacteria bacterium]|nr:hypothetical protein [Deltaproteobacteria bacterium]
MKGALVGGLVGGALMAVFMTLMNLVQGQDVWMGLKGPAAPFIGDAAMQPGFDGNVVLGALSHFAVAIAWAIPFALLGFGLAKGPTVALGVAWGILVWLAMTFVVLPIVGLGAMKPMMLTAPMAFEHLLYGLGLAAGLLPYQVVHTVRAPLRYSTP